MEERKDYKTGERSARSTSSSIRAALCSIWSFHQEMSTIDTPTCSTCMEKFPGMKVNGQSEFSSLVAPLPWTHTNLVAQALVW